MVAKSQHPKKKNVMENKVGTLSGLRAVAIVNPSTYPYEEESLNKIQEKLFTRNPKPIYRLGKKERITR